MHEFPDIWYPLEHDVGVQLPVNTQAPLVQTRDCVPLPLVMEQDVVVEPEHVATGSVIVTVLLIEVDMFPAPSRAQAQRYLVPDEVKVYEAGGKELQVDESAGMDDDSVSMQPVTPLLSVAERDVTETVSDDDVDEIEYEEMIGLVVSVDWIHVLPDIMQLVLHDETRHVPYVPQVPLVQTLVFVPVPLVMVQEVEVNPVQVGTGAKIQVLPLFTYPVLQDTNVQVEYEDQVPELHVRD